MKFYDREIELKALEKALSSKKAEMIVVSGRRRIGKSRLISESLKGKDHAQILIVPKEEKQVAADFAAALGATYTPSFANVEQALEYFFSNSKVGILYIDEFPNLLDVNPAIPYVFQRVWEKYKDSTSKILIFSGSYASMMNRIFTKQKAPLFNRAGYQMKLQPLSFKTVWKIQEDLKVNAVEKVYNYCIFGGIPFYYELIESQGTENIVHTMFFDSIAPLKEEGQNVLRQEFGTAYKKYFSIIEAMGGGIVSASEIANKIGVSQTTLSKYLMALQRDFQLVERTIPFDQSPIRSKKGVYSIKDNTIAFWFSSVYGKFRQPEAKEINEFISKRFESFCREFLVEYLQKTGETVIKAGRWWGQVETGPKEHEERELDIVVETKDRIYIGECKWTNSKISLRDIDHMDESSKTLLAKTKKTAKKALFSKSGFEFKEAGDILLFDPERIQEEIRKM